MRVVFPPAQMVVLPVMAGVRAATTSTTTVAVPGPQGVVTVTTYVVVETGLATGFEMAALLSPVAGDHEYEVPADAVSVVLPPVQMVVFGLAVTTGALVTVTNTG